MKSWLCCKSRDVCSGLQYLLQGPQVSADCASLQFGLVPLGTSSQLTLTLTSHTNTTITVELRQEVREGAGHREEEEKEEEEKEKESEIITVLKNTLKTFVLCIQVAARMNIILCIGVYGGPLASSYIVFHAMEFVVNGMS